ncbi:GRIP and coiled-coil domain-containing protein 1 isoform X2 [Acanthochromis polyacanthus]|uniref:GRIP and coiled-coil domain-containing protein 1 isoform X1 n=1 Tax=Acanthochromis polyacanthus TaxID=80966 RepID=UPI0022341BA2|nr:GRIP and coiled-coil domain-containing protein 1 isoform X1 [Acanthochromis polyacanthus]XP_051814178.1 GRIP and coiled-coil domain-containing protein 1 isoform X2 [Acanthochromis polyacanthus]XP_051814240.1 GRIP and coiled-coil domain-containing protein 1 isoform X2 [Acanthochromis polyacanthus]
MDKFGMSFGGGPSRKELLDTVESQKKQLVQYQTRFKDVVQAYKSLLKEKEALEASLKVLTATQDVDLNQQGRDAPELPEDGCSLHSEDSVETAASVETPSETARGDQSEEDQGEPGQSSSTPDTGGSDSSGVGTELQQATPPLSTEADRRVAHLRGQLSTLTGALATVTQEKSRMEANFLADKRQLKQEVEELQERMAVMATQQETELNALQQQVAEARARIITQQHEREQEQGDHAQQLRELQKILQQERDLRQDAELRLQDASTALLMTSQAVDRGAESEAHLSQVREERDELRRRLQAAEDEQKKPDPRVDEMHQQMKEMKESFQQQILSETRKVCEAEERARERAQSAELRVAGLEQRVSELSELLGSCEKAKQRDQQTTQRLRDRILQLDTENKTLAIAASSRTSSDLSLDESQLDVGVLKDKLQKVKKLLLLASQRNTDPNIQDLAEAEEDGTVALVYQQELRQVKEEFERYKLRAQVVLKNKNAKDGCQAKELEEVRDQLSELREKYINLRIQSDEAEARHRQQLEERQQQATALQHAHKQEAERAETLHREELLRLEAELHKQRERTMALLDEKDQELERLRAAVLTCSYSADGPADDTQPADPESEGDIISQALRQATPTESTLLLYAEQLARKEVEAGGLRRQKNRLEEDVHQLQAKLIANGERHDEEVSDLRGRLDKLVRDQSREGANMEYLKNVIYRFLTLQDSSGRSQTLNAILTILHFSPQEKHDVMRLQGPSWWGPNRR